MKKLAILTAIVALALAGTASADSLAVNATAAMGGTNFGMEVTHDNTSIAYVQDDTPSAETIYRAEWLFSPDTVAAGGANFRQTIFTAFTTNPNPGVGVCHPSAAFTEAIRCFHYQTFGGTIPQTICFVKGNQCGERSNGALLRISTADVNANDQVRFCLEWESNAGTDAGKLRVGLVDDDAACSTVTYSVRDVSNSLTSIDFVRLGTPQTNAFGAGETATYYFDEFASFRTLAP